MRVILLVLLVGCFAAAHAAPITAAVKADAMPPSKTQDKVDGKAPVWPKVDSKGPEQPPKVDAKGKEQPKLDGTKDNKDKSKEGKGMNSKEHKGWPMKGDHMDKSKDSKEMNSKEHKGRPMKGDCMGGRKRHMFGAVMPKVNECLKKYNKAVNVYINFNPEMMEKMHKEFKAMHEKPESKEDSKEESAESNKCDKKCEQMKAFMEGPAGAVMSKFMMAKVARFASKFVNILMRDIPEKNTNVAVGFGKTWWGINGADASKADWRGFKQEIEDKYHISALMENMGKMGLPMPMGGKDCPFGGMFGKMKGKNDDDDDSDEKPQWKQGMTMGGKPPMMMPGMKPPGDMTMPKDGKPPMMMPGMKPPGVNMEKSKEHFGGHGPMMFRDHLNISSNLNWAMIQMILNGTVTDFPVTKGFKDPGFNIVITGEDFELPLTADLILDIGGRYSNLTKNAHSPNENIFIAAPPESVMTIIPTLRYRICARSGGVSDVQPPRPTRPPKPNSSEEKGRLATIKPLAKEKQDALKPAAQPTKAPVKLDDKKQVQPTQAPVKDEKKQVQPTKAPVKEEKQPAPPTKAPVKQDQAKPAQVTKAPTKHD